MKNSYLVIVSCLVSIFLLYTLVFIYTFFNFNNEFKYTFKSLENLNFHEKYSKKTKKRLEIKRYEVKENQKIKLV